jgi:membrane protein
LLAASAGLSALGSYLGSHTEFAPLLLSLLNTEHIAFAFTLLFAAIFKVLPDTEIAWRDVAVGAMITALLFTAGKSLIGWYLGTTAASSGYGAAGALILILLWIYYSAQIFLFGAEIARAIAAPKGRRGAYGCEHRAFLNRASKQTRQAAIGARPDRCGATCLLRSAAG